MTFRLTLIAFALTVASVASVLAFFTAPPLGGRVDIADESAIIIWDSPPHDGTLHPAGLSLLTDAREFGFLVPTPAGRRWPRPPTRRSIISPK